MGVSGIPGEYLIFAATLLAIATLHRHALPAALLGLAVTLGYKLFALGLAGGAAWLAVHVGEEWPTLAHLLLLLVGFALLANQFEQSAIPDWMPQILPDDWTGGLVLLAIVFGLSIFI